MIRTYQLYSTHVNSNITVSYYEGVLKSFEAENPNIVIAEKEGLKYNLFYLEADFLKVAKEKGVQVTEIKREISFDMFWDKYNDKARSGKQEALAAWNKLKTIDRVCAYDYITVYDSQLKLNPVSKLHASSYLNKKRWIK